MTLIRFNNDYRPMSRAYNWNSVDRLMDAILRNEGDAKTYDYVPSVNIIENDRSFTLQLAVPGLKKEDLTIQVEQGVLVISREVENEAQQDLRFIRQEIPQGSFKRHFRLSRWVDQENIQARMENGLLEVEIMKKEEAVTKPVRQIDIS